MNIEIRPIALRLLPFLLALSTCTRLDQEQDPASQYSAKDYPVLEMQDSIQIDMYDGSYLAWILTTSYMKEMSDSKELFARPVNMVIYDSLESASAWVQSDSGSADEAVTFVNVWGHVQARSLDGVCVEADSLRWDKRGSRIRTDGWVKVVSEIGDTLTGVGFISDDRLENWKILSDVRGVIQKVESRVSEADSVSPGAEPDSGAAQ